MAHYLEKDLKVVCGSGWELQSSKEEEDLKLDGKL